MVMKLILYFSLIWLIPLILWQAINDTKFKKNLCIGVTLPFDLRDDEEIKNLVSKFKHDIKLICIILFIISFPVLLIKNEELALVYWAIWCILLILIPNIIEARANIKLKEIKNRLKNIKSSTSDEASDVHGYKNIVIVNTEELNLGKRLKFICFLPSILLPLIFIPFDNDGLIMYVVLTFTSILYYLCYRFTMRDKSEKIDNNVSLTKVLTQIRRKSWNKIWFVVSMSNILIALGFYLNLKFPVLSLICLFIITMGITIVGIKEEVKLRKLQEKLTKDSGREWYVDEDDYWIYGMFYYNKNDSNLIVNNRTGLNTTINLAKPLGKAIAIITILITLASILIVPIVSYSIKNSTVALNITNTEVKAMRKNIEYEVKINNIKDIKLMEELPKMKRVFGIGSQTLLNGKFSSEEYGKLKVNLDPTVKPFILIESKDGIKYLFGSRNPKETKNIYKKISSSTNKK